MHHRREGGVSMTILVLLSVVDLQSKKTLPASKDQLDSILSRIYASQEELAGQDEAEEAPWVRHRRLCDVID